MFMVLPQSWKTMMMIWWSCDPGDIQWFAGIPEDYDEVSVTDGDIQDFVYTTARDEQSFATIA